MVLVLLQVKNLAEEFLPFLELMCMKDLKYGMKPRPFLGRPPGKHKDGGVIVPGAMSVLLPYLFCQIHKQIRLKLGCSCSKFLL